MPDCADAHLVSIGRIGTPLVGVEPGMLLVCGLGSTPLLAIKPPRDAFTLQALERAADVPVKETPWCASRGGGRSIELEFIQARTTT